MSYAIYVMKRSEGTIKSLDKRIADLEAQCAIMREVLKETYEWLDNKGKYLATRNRIKEALAPDAGRALAERYRQESQYRWEVLCDAWNQCTEMTHKLEKAEAQAIKPLSLREFCWYAHDANHATASGYDEKEFMYRQLVDHGHIKEAE